VEEMMIERVNLMTASQKEFSKSNGVPTDACVIMIVDNDSFSRSEILNSLLQQTKHHLLSYIRRKLENAGDNVELS
jgi:C-terminal processing protease CtpA/Prc